MKLQGESAKGQTFSAITADAGTMTMEMAYLSYITKDKIFRNKAYAIIERFAQLKSPFEGLLPKVVHIGHEGVQTGSTHGPTDA